MSVQYLSRQLTSLSPTNEESAWLNEEKNHIGKKIVSQLSACELSTLSVRVYESGE